MYHIFASRSALFCSSVYWHSRELTMQPMGMLRHCLWCLPLALLSSCRLENPILYGVALWPAEVFEHLELHSCCSISKQLPAFFIFLCPSSPIPYLQSSSLLIKMNYCLKFIDLFVTLWWCMGAKCGEEEELENSAFEKKFGRTGVNGCVT